MQQEQERSREMGDIVNINGTISDANDAKISVFDHGFLFGDSVYETMRTYNRKIFLIDRHMNRLQNSANMLRLRLPIPVAKIKEELRRTIESSSHEECYLRLIVTRGKGKISLDPEVTEGSSYVIISLPYHPVAASAYENGVPLALVSTRRNNRLSLNPGMKSSNLLNNVLAYMEAKDQSAFEGILQNLSGFVTEGTSSNIFIVKSGKLLTPSLDVGLLPGVTRGLILELAANGKIAVEERQIKPEEVLACDECFITGTTKGVLPAGRIDDVQLSPVPGPVTRKIMDAYRSFVESQR
jgi:branched-chain amino acid aminotransferase